MMIIHYRVWLKSSLRCVAVICVILGILCTVPMAQASPYFGVPVVRYQPDGTAITVYLWGDEFGIIGETIDGFTVVRDTRDNSWCYARCSADGSKLESTGLRVGTASPVAHGITCHQRINKQVAQAQRAERKRAAGICADGASGSHWMRRAAVRTKKIAENQAPPSRTTSGSYVGLCILIDFSGSAGGRTRTQMDDFMNKVGNFDGYNSGSIRDYFYKVSGGRVTYTNVLPSTSVWATGYYRAVHPRSYYDSPLDESGAGAQTLIREALADLKNKDPTIFDSLTYDASGAAYALNVLYAGNRPDDWGTGLWPHQSSLATDFSLGNGKVISYYQISDMPVSLNTGIVVVPIGTICHENGHMLCDYPDLYEYSDAQPVAVGQWCLMGHGNYAGANGGEGFNPTAICGYLREKSGWADAVDLTETDVGSTKTARAVTGAAADGNVFRIRKSSTEYFLIENRDTFLGGMDQYLPGPGIVVFHVDERGSNTYPAQSRSGQRECTLIQANGGNDLITGAARVGSPQMAFSGAGQAEYTFQSRPTAAWYNGLPSTLGVESISIAGSTMTFRVSSSPEWLDVLTPVSGDKDNSHCGSGGGLTLIGALLVFGIVTRLRKNNRT